MCTPDFSHITSDDYNFVYEPAEDSFLLIDALEKDIDYIRSLRPSIALEIGSGSGICSTFLSKEIGFTVHTICTDINPRASLITQKTGIKNKVWLEPVTTDLVSGLSDRLTNKVDVLLFNPPYVVTPSEEVGSSGIEASWAGGVKGREVTDRLLPLIGQLLSDQGLFYLVVIKENDQDEIESILKSQGLKMTVLISRRSGPEFLSILRFSRTSTKHELG